MKIKNMLYAAMFAAIVAVLGLMPPIPLPFIPVPITLQTMGVMLAGSFLGKRLGFMIVLLGVPILSGGRGGMAVLAGPTGGFFIVWPFAAFLIGFLVEKSWKNINIAKYIVANIIGGIVLVYLVGAIYLSYITKMPIDKAFLATMAFIPGDMLKAVVVSILCYKLKEISPINKVIR